MRLDIIPYVNEEYGFDSVSYVEDDAGTISLYVRWISWIAKPPDICEIEEVTKIYHRDI